MSTEQDPGQGAEPPTHTAPPPPPPAFESLPPFDPLPPLDPLPAFAPSATSDPPPAAPPRAPETWEPPVAPSPRAVDGTVPWGLTDPGPIIDGTWQSPGYGASTTRATAARVFIGLGLVANVLVLTTTIAVGGALSDLTAGRVSATDLGAAATVSGVASLLAMVFSLAALVAMMAWTGRMVDNIPPLTGRTPERSPQWALWSWLIPFASLVLPYIVLRDAFWRLRASPDQRVPRWLLLWWIARIGSGYLSILLGWLSASFSMSISAIVALEIGLLVLPVLTGIGDFAVITAISRREDAQAANLGLLGASGRRWPAFLPGWETNRDEDEEDEFVDDDPLARQRGESEADHRDRLLAALEAEAVRH
jgi:hypothetical protein